MALSCTLRPSNKNGEELKGWKEYKDVLGYSVARDVFTASVAPSYIEKYKDILELDDQGIPTVQSTIRTPLMKRFIPKGKRMQAMEKEYGFERVENTDENFNMLVKEAKNFNDRENEFIAYVERDGDGIRIVLHHKTKEAVITFNNQYGTTLLNNKLLEIMRSLGITPGLLMECEAGSSGVTDFSRAKEIAGQFRELIRLAKGMEGQMALSEEFSHVIIRALANNPLVQRAIQAYSNNLDAMKEVLGNDYEAYASKYVDEDGNTDFELLGEECVGRKLRESLLKRQNAPKNFLERLVERIKNLLFSLVKNINHDEISNAIVEADQTIDELAKGILTDTVKVTKEDIKKINSKRILHHLDSGIRKLDKIVSDAILTEQKKRKILKNNDNLLTRVKKREIMLKAIQDETPEGQLRGIVNYTKAAREDLAATLDTLNKLSMQDKNVHILLRAAMSALQSYTPYLKQLSELLISNDNDLSRIISETSIDNPDQTKDTLRSVFDDLTSVHALLESRFCDLAMNSFENFLKPFLDVDIVVDKNGRKQTLRQIIEESNGDISFIDRYLQTMSTSGDMLLQLFGDVVAKAKGAARIQTINDIDEISLLQEEAERAGITDFDYFFERDDEGHKTGNYTSEVWNGQHYKEYKEMLDEMDVKYGKNPNKEKADKKKEEISRWVKIHSKSIKEPTIPKEGTKANPAWEKLSTKQKEILKKYKALKEKYDKRYPPSKITDFKAIQRRKTQTERRFSFLDGASVWCDGIKEQIKQDLMETADDDQQFGQKTGLRDFSGQEHMMLPILYNNRLSNPDDLSTDVFGSLSAYAYASNVYTQLDDVVDPLEIGRIIVNNPKTMRHVSEVRSGEPMVERLGRDVFAKIFKTGGSNIEAKLQDFMESQVYGRYYKDNDTVFKVGKERVKVDKALNKFLSISSVAQLGFNWCANAANIFTGLGMQNIEAVAGQFFNVKELAKADTIYIKELLSFLPELESRDKTSKLALFDELFDIKQDFRDKAGRSRVASLIKRTFGETVAFLGQTCGDHWLYNRTALAMALRTKVIVTKDGKEEEMNLWEALKVEDRYKDKSGHKALRLPKGTRDAVSGKIIDVDWITQWAESVKYVNHRLFGVYNTDDMVAAERTIKGRMLLQFRKWIVPQMAARFDDKKYILAAHTYTEGYYRTFLNFAIGLKNGQKNILEQWRDLDTWQRQNIIRCLAEWTQFAAVWALSQFLIGHNDDPESFWNNKYLEYIFQREMHELGNLTPSFTMGREVLKTVQSPIAAISSAQNALNVMGSLIDPRDWFDEMQSGPYQGHSTLYKHIMKAPLPILPQIRQMDRFLNNIDDATLYYTRSY